MRNGWAVWGAALAIYVLAVFHRTSLGVAGLVAVQRFDISAAQLSAFTVVQLLVYAAMQVPVGMLLDRFGPRRMLLIGVATMTVAQLAFAVVPSYPWAVAARVLVGAGDAMVFISVLRLVATWFPPARIPLVTQVTGVTGQLGSVFAALPMTVALRELGWTGAYVSAAAVGVALGIVLLVVVRDTPRARVAPGPAMVPAQVLAGLRAAWAEPGTRLGLWTHFTTQFSGTTLGLLWGYPFLVQGEGLSPTAAGTLLTLLIVSTMLASPVIAWVVSRRPFSRSTLVLWVVAAIVAAWTVVLAWPGRVPMPLLVLLVLVVGVGGPTSMVGFDFARTFNPPERLGSATGIVNVGGWVASLVLMLLIGLVLDWRTPGASTDYSTQAFRLAMATQYLGWGLGGWQVWRHRRRARRLLAARDPQAYEALRHHGRVGTPVVADRPA